MPTLSLYTPNPIADASHAVGAPGGYEWWYFDAEDPATDTQIVGIFLHGFVFHPKYLRSYARYRRRPTHHAPPVPSDFPCAYFVIYQHGKIVSQFMTQHRPTEYAAEAADIDVRIGPNRLSHADGALNLHLEGPPWALTWQGPKTRADQKLIADLKFRPASSHVPAEREFLSRAMAGAQHHWVIANPNCQVTGTITQQGTSRAPIEFVGRGYHDHNYGTGPLGPGLSRWFWGRAMLEDQVVTFHYAVPKDHTLAPESHVIIADGSGLREAPIRPAFGRSKRTVLNLAYPIEATWSGLMTLSRPRIIDSAPFYLRLQYDARIGDRSTTAFCEMAYPHRLRWPILGRMIEMSIWKPR